MFRLATVGMMYGFYKIAKECWHSFSRLDEYEYNDWHEDEFVCQCGVIMYEDEINYVNGRKVCDYCVFG